jgi:fatty-acyl-CoA synthase
MIFKGVPLAEEPALAGVPSSALTMPGFLKEVAERYGEREALCFHENGEVTRWSYARLLEESTKLAKALAAKGLGKGSRVAWLMGNRPEWVAGAFGAAMAGCVFVPVNTLLGREELLFVLSHSDAALLGYQPRLASHDYRSDLDGVLDAPDRLPFLRELVELGSQSWESFLGQGDQVSDASVAARATSVAPYDDAIVIYTSGTTEEPKGVLHPHRSPAIQFWRFARLLCLDGEVRSWSAFPFFWSAGMAMVLGATLAAGGCVVLQEYFEPGEALWLLEHERVTSPHAWPHQLAAMEAHPDFLKAELSSIRQVDADTSLGRHPSVKLSSPWSQRSAYGTTETFTLATAIRACAPPEEREGHHGHVLSGNEVRIVDPDTGEDLGVGQTGEIRVKGATLMKGYLKISPEKVFDEKGFFGAGDAGYMDEMGRLHWEGRTSGLIKSAGANISPVEIESMLRSHPQVAHCAVVGIPHETLGEMVVAAVVPKAAAQPSEEELKGFLKERLASYKVPRRIVFLAEGELVTTASAKVRTDQLRNLLSGRLQASEAG